MCVNKYVYPSINLRAYILYTIMLKIKYICRVHFTNQFDHGVFRHYNVSEMY